MTKVKSNRSKSQGRGERQAGSLFSHDSDRMGTMRPAGLPLLIGSSCFMPFPPVVCWAAHRLRPGKFCDHATHSSLLRSVADGSPFACVWSVFAVGSGCTGRRPHHSLQRCHFGDVVRPWWVAALTKFDQPFHGSKLASRRQCASVGAQRGSGPAFIQLQDGCGARASGRPGFASIRLTNSFVTSVPSDEFPVSSSGAASVTVTVSVVDVVPDGIKVGESGDLFVTGPKGIWVWDANGNHLGTIAMAEQSAN
jgi:hypothetical protein